LANINNNENKGGDYAIMDKTMVDDCLQIDINRLIKKGYITEQKLSLVWTWSRRRGESSVGLTISRVGMNLSYTTAQGKNIDYFVPLTYTQTRFGERPWFSCPKCGSKAAKLYFKDTHFLCRHCQQLSYNSQSEARCINLVERVRKIRRTLGIKEMAVNCSTRLLANRPRYMHKSTYNNLLDKAEQLELMASADFSARCAAILARKPELRKRPDKGQDQ